MIANFPLLTLITFLPLAGMAITAFIPRKSIRTLRAITIGVTIVQLALAVFLWVNYNGSLGAINDPKSFQYVERYSWIRISGLGIFENLNIDYFLGLDGLSVTMVLLTAIVAAVGAIASFSIDRNIKGYFLMYLLLDIGMMGTFCALDFFLFYIFWELLLLPMYFLIGIWGGARREYAAIKFFLYTLLGSVFMFLVMIGFYFSNQVMLFIPGTHHVMLNPITHKPELYHTFSMLRMMDPSAQVSGSIFSGLGTVWRYAGFFALFFAFAVKIPMVPFHTWLPDAHVEAPTAISVVLAGVLLKMGGYGILRLSLGLFPEISVALAWYMALFGVINIVYGALCAMAQSDFKKLIAYSSVSHMGFVLLGISSLNAQGMVGSVMQMFNHGIVTAMLFLLVGVLYDRTQTRGVLEFGGLANQMPRYFGLIVIAFFAALGLPAFSMFISEAFVFLGAFQTWQILTAIATTGIVLTAAYFLLTLQRMFFGTVPERWQSLSDINVRELISIVPLAALAIAVGIYPGPLVDTASSTMSALVSFLHIHAPQVHAAIIP